VVTSRAAKMTTTIIIIIIIIIVISHIRILQRVRVNKVMKSFKIKLTFLNRCDPLRFSESIIYAYNPYNITETTVGACVNEGNEMCVQTFCWTSRENTSDARVARGWGITERKLDLIIGAGVKCLKIQFLSIIKNFQLS
jgi:hypothetical protein